MRYYREIYQEINDEEPPKPLIVTFVAVHESKQAACEMHDNYIYRYCQSTLEHYEFHNADLANVEGYEYYLSLIHI